MKKMSPEALAQHVASSVLKRTKNTFSSIVGVKGTHGPSPPPN